LQRIVTTVCSAAVAAMIIYGGIGYAQNPYKARQQELLNTIETTTSDWNPPATPERISPDVLHSTIVTRREVWDRLVPPPPPKKNPFDMEKAMRGISVTRQSIGDRVKIKTPNNKNGDFYSVGDRIGDVRIKQITKSAVVFQVIHDGKEYTKTLPRP